LLNIHDSFIHSLKMIDTTHNINSGLKSIEERFFKSAISVDCVIFGFDGKDLKVLLIRSYTAEFKGQWSLIGDLLTPDEDMDGAAYRILRQRTGLDDIYLEQVHAFGRVERHPLGRVVTVAYYSLININDYNAETEVAYENSATWHNVKEVGELAFDHNEILTASLKHLKVNLASRPIGINLLPEKFTLTELQSLYDAILDSPKPLDKRNFRKKILSMGILKDLNELQKDVAHRPAKLYSFDSEGYNALLKSAF